jgi:hypothetical protein
LRVVVFLAPAVRFAADDAARPPFAAVFFAVEPLRLAVERAVVREVPDVERARDVPDPDRDVADFARDAVDFARVPVADFAREAVDFVADFAREAVDFAREVVAAFARDVVGFAREVVPDLAREVVALAREAVDFARDVPEVDRARDVVPPADLLAAVVFPPLLPAAFFCAVVPPRLEVERDELRDVPEAERDRLDEVDRERDRLVPLDLLGLRGVAARTRETASSLWGCCGCSASLASSSGCGE